MIVVPANHLAGVAAAGAQLRDGERAALFEGVCS